ncbi:hypothetical protein SERLADRAFT_414660 [Serpula lacrymans var. lacrymans S7.9]|uniref:Uncharacterized protein n=1 Tax=Serpula lacrymans var. lacrymans (strain S7.9) TaxID=578457 RepID=F8NRG8_SERL9|nr:uncharacterized protein SERLADRAFT_414660 [Serpula lacrymans var. lacrymans S7.9]EGO26761.1 hypothetical protein SERLADRAFT_414660 [Serpula lacrymans var. lacrymans S7.9]
MAFRVLGLFLTIQFINKNVHRKALHKLFVDAAITSPLAWNKFIDKISNELQEQNLLATMLLNANVGFLAIQTVDNGSNIGVNDNVTRSPIQVASYVLLVASVGSIILGLILLRHNRTEVRETVEEAVIFLNKMGHEKYGQEALPLICSLPYVLLMWGMLLFLVALLMECYYPRAEAPSLIVGVASLTVFVLTSGCIYILNTEQNGRPKWSLKIFFDEQLELTSMADIPVIDGSDNGSPPPSLLSCFSKRCMAVFNGQARREQGAVIELLPANTVQGQPSILGEASLQPDRETYFLGNRSEV